MAGYGSCRCRDRNSRRSIANRPVMQTRSAVVMSSRCRWTPSLATRCRHHVAIAFRDCSGESPSARVTQRKVFTTPPQNEVVDFDLQTIVPMPFVRCRVPGSSNIKKELMAERTHFGLALCLVSQDVNLVTGQSNCIKVELGQLFKSPANVPLLLVSKNLAVPTSC